MQAVILSNLRLTSKTPEVTMMHNGEQVNFSISVFGRASFFKDNDGVVEDYDVFEDINAYWASLDMDKQDRIFDIYKDISDSFTNLALNVDLGDYIAAKIKELYALNSYEDISTWTAFKGNIVIPPSIKNDYEANLDNNTSREKTYTQHDYLQLMRLSLCLRPLLPIWGEYISNTRREKGTQFKEFYAFQLLMDTPIMSLEPMVKLKSYIDNVVDNKAKPDMVLKWISSEDFNYWLLSLLCIKKLSVCDIKGVNTKYNVVSYLYRYIKQKSESKDNNFQSLYKEKRFSSISEGMESKLSSLEMYKIKSNIAPGEIVEIEYGLRDIHNAVKPLFKDYDELEVIATIDKIKTSGNYEGPILSPQMLLLGWCFKTIVSPRGLLYIPKRTILGCLGALEEVLWSRGHKYLALLATSYTEESDDYMTVSPVDSKIRLNEDLKDELYKKYPYSKVSYVKKRSSFEQGKTVNLTEEAINNITDMLTMHTWKLSADRNRVKEVFGSNISNWVVKPDIRNYLAELAIDFYDPS